MITEVRKNMKVKVIAGGYFNDIVGEVIAADLEDETVTVQILKCRRIFGFDEVEEVKEETPKINANVADFKNGFVLTKNIKAVLMEQQNTQPDLYLITILHEEQETCIYDLALEDARKIVQDIQNAVSRFYDAK